MTEGSSLFCWVSTTTLQTWPSKQHMRKGTHTFGDKVVDGEEEGVHKRKQNEIKGEV